MPFKPHFAWDLLSPEEIESRVIRAFQNHISYITESNRCYAERVTLRNITDISEIEKIPPTTIEDLKNFRDDFIRLSPKSVAETVLCYADNNPILFPLSSSDVDRIAYDCSLFFHWLDISQKETFVIFDSLDLGSPVSLAVYKGFSAIGVNTFRFGNRISSENIEIVKQIKSDGIVCSSETLELLYRDHQEVLSEAKLIILTVNERGEVPPCYSDAKERFHLFTLIYMPLVSTIYCECPQQQGLHIHPELSYVEVLDSTGKPLPEGEEGLIHVTPFGVVGVPLLRFNTGLKGRITSSACSCGKTSFRVEPLYTTVDPIKTTEKPQQKPVEIAVVETPKEVKKDETPLQQLIRVLDTAPQVRSYVLEYRGKKGSEEIHIHADMLNKELPELRSLLQKETGRAYIVLVCNKPTIESLKKICTDPVLPLIDKRGS